MRCIKTPPALNLVLLIPHEATRFTKQLMAWGTQPSRSTHLAISTAHTTRQAHPTGCIRERLCNPTTQQHGPQILAGFTRQTSQSHLPHRRALHAAPDTPRHNQPTVSPAQHMDAHKRRDREPRQATPKVFGICQRFLEILGRFSKTPTRRTQCRLQGSNISTTHGHVPRRATDLDVVRLACGHYPQTTATHRSTALTCTRLATTNNMSDRTSHTEEMLFTAQGRQIGSSCADL